MPFERENGAKASPLNITLREQEETHSKIKLHQCKLNPNLRKFYIKISNSPYHRPLFMSSFKAQSTRLSLLLRQR